MYACQRSKIAISKRQTEKAANTKLNTVALRKGVNAKASNAA